MRSIFNGTSANRSGLLAALLGLMVSVIPRISHADLSVNQVSGAFFERVVLKQGADDLALEDAYQFQQLLVEGMAGQLGPRSGFKVAMTSVSSQHHFGISEPLYGQFLQSMLLPSPARLPVGFGARGLIEADLLVRVKDAAINEVTSLNDLLAHLDAVIPFIELPDPLWSTRLTAARLVAVNCGARYGVLAEPIALTGNHDWYQRLESFTVQLRDPEGAVLAAGNGSDLLGHPLNVVFWLVQHLRQRGDGLQPGDLISLGSLTKPQPPQSGQYLAEYTGLDPSGPVTVNVEFFAAHQEF